MAAASRRPQLPRRRRPPADAAERPHRAAGGAARRCAATLLAGRSSMHGSIGPSAALARCGPTARLEVWSHSQGIGILRAALAHALGLDPRRVRVRTSRAPGCYGHNGADDVAFDAVLVARAVPGRPVLLKWTRADEHAGSRTASAMRGRRRRRSLDDDGRLRRLAPRRLQPRRTAPAPGRGRARRCSPLARWPTRRACPAAADADRDEAGIHRNATAGLRSRATRIVKHFVDRRRRCARRPCAASARYVNVFAIESIDGRARRGWRAPTRWSSGSRTCPTSARARCCGGRRARPAGRPRRCADGRGLGIGYARYKNTGAYVAVVARGRGRRRHRRDPGPARCDRRRRRPGGGPGRRAQPDRGRRRAGDELDAAWSGSGSTGAGSPATAGTAYPILPFSDVPEVETVLLDRPGDAVGRRGRGRPGPDRGGDRQRRPPRSACGVRDLPLTPERLRRAAAEPELAASRT